MKKFHLYPVLLGSVFFVASCTKNTFTNLTPQNSPVGDPTLIQVPTDSSTFWNNYDLPYQTLEQMMGIAPVITSSDLIVNQYDVPWTSGNHKITVALAEFFQPMANLTYNFQFGNQIGAVTTWLNHHGWRDASLQETEGLLARLGPSHPLDSLWLFCTGSWLGAANGKAGKGSYFVFGSGGILGPKYQIGFVANEAPISGAAMKPFMDGKRWAVLAVRE